MLCMVQDKDSDVAVEVVRLLLMIQQWDISLWIYIYFFFLFYFLCIYTVGLHDTSLFRSTKALVCLKQFNLSLMTLIRPLVMTHRDVSYLSHFVWTKGKNIECSIMGISRESSILRSVSLLTLLFLFAETQRKPWQRRTVDASIPLFTPYIEAWRPQLVPSYTTSTLPIILSFLTKKCPVNGQFSR